MMGFLSGLMGNMGSMGGMLGQGAQQAGAQQGSAMGGMFGQGGGTPMGNNGKGPAGQPVDQAGGLQDDQIAGLMNKGSPSQSAPMAAGGDMSSGGLAELMSQAMKYAQPQRENTPFQPRQAAPNSLAAYMNSLRG